MLTGTSGITTINMTHQEIVKEMEGLLSHDNWGSIERNYIDRVLTNYHAQVLKVIGRGVVKMEDKTEYSDKPDEDYKTARTIGYNLALDRVLLYLSSKHPTN